MPGINDAPEQVAPILELASEAGAAYVTGIALHLRSEVKDLFFEWLRAHRPELIPRYQELYRRGAYVPARERERLAQLVTGPGDDSGPGAQPPSAVRGRSRTDAAPADHDGELARRRAAGPDQRRLF